MSAEGFEMCMDFVFEHEGVLSDDAADKGGLTKYGVSMAYLQDLAKRKPSLLVEILGTSAITRSVVKGITKTQAALVFKWTFWTPYQLDDLPLPAAFMVFDMNVNHGPGNSIRIAQKGCNRLPSLVSPLLVVDGKMGPRTRAALRLCSCASGIHAIAAERLAFYERIVERNSSQRVFLRGWRNRAHDMEQTALGFLSA